MKITRANVQDAQGKIIGDAITWGNNAAWHCFECDQLLGGRTADSDYIVTCPCGAKYEILRSPNKNGQPNFGPATGVKKI